MQLRGLNDIDCFTESKTFSVFPPAFPSALVLDQTSVNVIFLFFAYKMSTGREIINSAARSRQENQIA
jgi:hypothetical protein